MKPIQLAAIAALAVSSAFAQGTTAFNVSLNGAQATPPNNSIRTASGQFTLDPAMLFAGFIGTEDYADITSVSIFSSPSPSQAGTLLYNFTPGGIVQPGPSGEPGSQQFDFARSLTASEVSDLQSGRWYVGIIVPGFADGVIRGQITVVPEPTAFGLLIFATIAAGCLRRNSR